MSRHKGKIRINIELLGCLYPVSFALSMHQLLSHYTLAVCSALRKEFQKWIKAHTITIWWNCVLLRLQRLALIYYWMRIIVTIKPCLQTLVNYWCRWELQSYNNQKSWALVKVLLLSSSEIQTLRLTFLTLCWRICILRGTRTHKPNSALQVWNSDSIIIR